METIKSAAFAGCLVGIAITILGLSAPDNGIKKAFEGIMSIILVLTMITPFVKTGFNTSEVITSANTDDITENSEIMSYADELYINQIKAELENNIGLYLKKENIPFSQISIQTKIDEYNFLEVESVEIKAEEKYRDRISDIIKTLLGEQTQTKFN